MWIGCTLKSDKTATNTIIRNKKPFSFDEAVCDAHAKGLDHKIKRLLREYTWYADECTAMMSDYYKFNPG